MIEKQTASDIPVLSTDFVLEKLKAPAAAPRNGYMAMYSTWLGGIVTNPNLMFVPVDDHIVHRGDGVFEAAKCVSGRLYALDPHLDRLERSAERIGLKLPHSKDEIRKIAIESLIVSGARDAMIRIYVSRGPGGFTANPYESIGSQLYLVITPYKPVATEKYDRGVRVSVSAIPVKEGFFSQVKSCNYLPNVLMKKESVDRGDDFTVAVEANGNLAESSTENFAIITRDGDLLIPKFDRTLRGITALRTMALAKTLVKAGRLRSIQNADLNVEQVFTAKEAMMIGTTLDVLPVTSFEGRAIGDGTVGPICRELLQLIREDMRSGEFAHRVCG